MSSGLGLEVGIESMNQMTSSNLSIAVDEGMEGDWFAMQVAQDEGTVHDSITIRFGRKDYVVIFTQKREGMCPSAFNLTFKSHDVSFNLSDNINLHQ